MKTVRHKDRTENEWKKPESLATWKQNMKHEDDIWITSVFVFIFVLNLLCSYEFALLNHHPSYCTDKSQTSGRNVLFVIIFMWPANIYITIAVS